MTRSFCNLKYSRICNVPLLGYIFLASQIGILWLGLSNTLFLSEKEKKYLCIIIHMAEHNYPRFVCQTARLGRVLALFSKPIKLDVKRSSEFEFTDLESYYLVLWSLVLVSSVTRSTYRTLTKFDWATPALIKEMEVE